MNAPFQMTNCRMVPPQEALIEQLRARVVALELENHRLKCENRRLQADSEQLGWIRSPDRMGK